MNTIVQNMSSAYPYRLRGRHMKKMIKTLQSETKFNIYILYIYTTIYIYITENLIKYKHF